MIQLLALLSSLTLSSAFASPARCLLQIDGRTYLNSDCNYSPLNDGEGSFSIGTDDASSRYFAYVLIHAGVALGYWNGASGGSHAHDELGQLKRNGACLSNSRAIVCAWAK